MAEISDRVVEWMRIEYEQRNTGFGRPEVPIESQRNRKEISEIEKTKFASPL